MRPQFRRTLSHREEPSRARKSAHRSNPKYRGKHRDCPPAPTAGRHAELLRPERVMMEREEAMALICANRVFGYYGVIIGQNREIGNAKLLKRKSGTRDSNPRLRPWQSGAQLKIKSIVSMSFIPNHQKRLEFHYAFPGLVLMRQKCGRTSAFVLGIISTLRRNYEHMHVPKDNPTDSVPLLLQPAGLAIARSD